MPTKRFRARKPPHKPRPFSNSSVLESDDSEHVSVSDTNAQTTGNLGPVKSKYFDSEPEKESCLWRCKSEVEDSGHSELSEEPRQLMDSGLETNGGNRFDEVFKNPENSQRSLELQPNLKTSQCSIKSSKITKKASSAANAESSTLKRTRRTSVKLSSEELAESSNSVVDAEPRLLPTNEAFAASKRLKLGHEFTDSDTIVRPSTMEFLRQLAKHNDRSWFAEHDMLYRAAKQNFDTLVEKLSEAIVEGVDTTVPELPLKDLVFRIYRDIRFSNDQTPYKVYFSAAWSRTGKKGPYACYYLQIQPGGKGFVGGGIWQADSHQLNLLRRELDRNPQQLKDILTEKGMALEFLGLRDAGDEAQAVGAFVEQNAKDALKTAPKNFAKNHPEIDLLRLRSYTVGKSVEDEQVTSPHFFHQVVELFKKMEPLITYLNSVVMPDF